MRKKQISEVMSAMAKRSWRGTTKRERREIMRKVVQTRWARVKQQKEGGES